MKKLFVLSFVVLLTFSLNAQRFGARLGGNFAGMRTTLDTRGTKVAPGMTIGLLTELGPEKVSLRIEANFAQKGFNVDRDDELGTSVMNTVAKVNYNYFELPVLAKVKVFGPLYVYAGPYFGFAFSGKQIINEFSIDGVVLTDPELDALGIVKDQDLFADDLYKKTDFGAAAGFGAQFGLGPIHAFAEGRATLGLSNLYDTEGDAFNALVTDGTLLSDDNKKNMVFTIAVGIVLGK